MPNPVINRRVVAGGRNGRDARNDIDMGTGGSGETFDFYPVGSPVHGLSLGNGYTGPWRDQQLFLAFQADDSFDTLADGVAVHGKTSGFGYTGGWVDRDLGADPQDPATVTDLIDLWDAEAIIASDTDPLSQWVGSVNGLIMTQATGALQPVYRTNQLPSGGPAIRFTDQYFNVPDISGHAAYEAFILLKVDNDPPPVVGQTGLWKFHPSGAANATQYPSNADGAIYDNFASTTQKATGNPGDSLTGWRVYNPRSAAGSWVQNLEGIQRFSTGTNTVSMPNTGLTLGFENYNSGAISLFMRGEIAFFAVFSRILTITEREGIYKFISAKRN
jgi:hypothetical protein